MTFSGQNVLVAGGTGGLGRAVSLAFLAAGATVSVTYRNRGEFEALSSVAEATETSSLEGYAADLTDDRAIQELVAGLIAKHGRIDALVNTAGGYAGGAKLWESDPKIFEQMLALNFRSGLALSRAVVPAMLRQNSGGVIVNVASKAALDHAPGLAAYSASKAAALSLMNSLAEELKGTGIRVNSILPSIIDTNANRKAMPHADFSKWPKPEEIARVVLFLCSDDAKVVHGAAIPVYGNN